MDLFGIGFGNFISAQRIVVVLTPDSSPVKRLIHVAKEDCNLIDASCGRKTQSVIVMDGGQIVLSAFTPETIAEKLKKSTTGENADERQK